MDAKSTDGSGRAADPYNVRKYFEPLRVVDVVDAMDGIGYFNIGLVSQEIRPLWLGLKFWGPAVKGGRPACKGDPDRRHEGARPTL